MSSLRRRTRALALALAALASATAAACSIPFEPVLPDIANTCELDADCGPSAACVALDARKLCVAREANLGAIRFEVQPAASQAFGADTPFLLARDDGAALDVSGTNARGVVVQFDQKLPELITLAGRVHLAEGYELCDAGGACCALGAGRTIPASLTFQRERQFLGLGDASKTTAAALEGDAYGFSASVVQNERHAVYVVPAVPEGCELEPPPPQLLELGPQKTSVGVDVPLAAPRMLELSMKLAPASKLDLSDFVVEVLDARTGLRTSNAPTPVAHAEAGYVAALAYTRTASTISPVVRLSDPAVLGKPALFWELDALDFDGDGRATVALDVLAETSKDLQATVTEPGASGAGVPGATVIVQSAFTEGDPTVPNNYAFRLVTETDANGVFPARLPPGRYKVVVEPNAESGFAVTEAEWVVTPTELCCGRTVAVNRQPTLEGRVRTPFGDPFTGVSVLATSSLRGSSGLLSNALTYEPSLVEGTSSADGDGAFSVSVDPGLYDFSVRPEAASGFPWLVRQGLIVPAEGRSLDVADTSFPAIVRGRLVDPEGKPLAGAAVRAFVTLAFAEDRRAVADGAAIAVGETFTADDGTYTLALPSTAVVAPEDEAQAGTSTSGASEPAPGESGAGGAGGAGG